VKKQQLKLLTDLVLLASFSTIVFTDLLMWLVIPTGQEGNPYFLGLHRHGWGDIHLFFSIIFSISSIFHIYLNFAQIKGLLKKAFNDEDNTFIYASLSFIPLTFIALIFKLIIK